MTPDRQRWQEAVDLGALGRHAAARAVLRGLRTVGDPAVRSLAASTEASLLRQRGLHAAAAIHDGRALAIASSMEHGVPGKAEATADAVIGLAADSLGPRRLARARVLLDRCRPDGWRTAVRLEWVRAETDLADCRPDEAVHHARRAVDLAARSSSRRHHTKSNLILAAALLTAGARDEAVNTVDTVRRAALGNGWIPLAWAAEMLASASGDEQAAGAARTHAAVLAHLGGPLA